MNSLANNMETFSKAIDSMLAQLGIGLNDAIVVCMGIIASILLYQFLFENKPNSNAEVSDYEPE